MLTRIHTLEELAREEGPLHLALGVFDGIHVGHQVVIERAVSAAKRDGGKAYVVTFSPHPIRVIAPGKAPKSLLATLDEKADVIASRGVDGLLIIQFDEEFARMTAEDFIVRLTKGNVATIAVGEDWRFGSKRVGDAEMLGEASKIHGFALEAVSPVMWDGERISSTRIRQAIRDGNFKAAENMLGRPYEVTGRVIEGRKLGRQLGFPTANLSLGDLQVPRDGVWAVTVDGKKLGVANLGVRPTVGGTEKLLEIHLLDFSGDLYGQYLHVKFDRFIRDEKKFSSVEELKGQIARDVAAAKG